MEILKQFKLIIAENVDVSLDAKKLFFGCKLNFFEIQYKLEPLDFWVTQHPDLIFPDKSAFQRNWDLQLMTDKHQQLLSHLGSPHRAILLAIFEHECGVWLDALPSANLGTLLDKHVLQIAISLRIGSDICQPHTCVCGTLVDRLGHHGLSCSKKLWQIFST